jgi:hypothetical protein
MPEGRLGVNTFLWGLCFFVSAAPSGVEILRLFCACIEDNDGRFWALTIFPRGIRALSA